MICKPKNELMLKAINKVLYNIENNFYGNHPLEPTGPLMLKNIFPIEITNNLKLNLYENENKEAYIRYGTFKILEFHKNYRKEQDKVTSHWGEYYYNRNMYKKDNNYKTNYVTVFTDIYENNKWGNNNNEYYKGSSGPASSYEEQINRYVPFLRTLINNRKVKTIVDLGCGDFKVGNILYDDLDIKYTGYDAYEKVISYNNLVNKNKEKYDFIHLDLFNNKEKIINGDLCILKDILMHWPLTDIYTFMDYIVESKLFKYILIINDLAQKKDNTDIPTGEFRPLSVDFFPLKKYNLVKIFTYNYKEASLLCF
jgi:SAM-dependent methyltransferase